jgi:hypothetical protein
VKKKADQFWPASAFDVSTGKLWACYYDTTGDSARQHAWFVCTSSRDGKQWRSRCAPPRRPRTPACCGRTRASRLRRHTAFGGYTGVAAAGGAVYPLWIDTRDIGGNREEVFASVIR